MTDNHPAVDEIVQKIPKNSKFGPNKIREYNQVFFPLEDHWYTDEINQLREQIINETKSDNYHYLPEIKSVCRMIVGLTGVDEDLESDLPRNF